jgi:hypothetical protein
MLHSLLTEIVRRRLWPIPLIAVAVAVGAPLLFLKSSGDDAPSAAVLSPAVAREGKLPARAQRLLAAGDAAATAEQRRGATRKSHDPFRPPPGHRSTERSSAAAATKDSSSSARTDKPVAVVITNADGSVTKPATTPAPSVGGDDTPSKTATTPALSVGGDDTPSKLTVSSAAVDVRFGAQPAGKLRREIPRLQTFVADGDIVAVFVKYSPKRDKAVFAIAPSTIVTGDVDCRRKGGVCRYVDIPAGSYARLTMLGQDGSLVSRRLDVVRVHHNG